MLLLAGTLNPSGVCGAVLLTVNLDGLGDPVNVNVLPDALCEWEEQGWLICFKHHVKNMLEIVNIN